jgi:hypothetical protein
MAEETAGKEPGPKDEVDVVRAAIYFLAILLAGLAAVFWVLRGRRDDYQKAIEGAAKTLPAMKPKYDAVTNLVKQYRDSGTDEAKSNPRTWLQQRYRLAGIQDGQVTTEKWNDRPSKDYVEHYVDVLVKGVRQDQAVHFLWNVESVSPKMRTIEMRLTRTPPNNAPETDLWELKASFGYREPRGLKPGS